MTGPKILFLDIETQPDVVYTWGVYESNAIAVKEHWQILSYSAEWLHTDKNITRGLDDTQRKVDDELCQELWNLLDEADIVVAHNGVDFDIKKINARFIAHNMLPPSPYAVVDTKREVKRAAAFSSNKLDWLCQQLEIGKKLEHEGFGMWLGCMAGDPKAWRKMKRYNKHDVKLLKQLYLTLLPWMKQPNMNLWSEEAVCPNPACGSKQLEQRGYSRNKTRKYIRYQCKVCGTWTRSTHSEPKGAEVVRV